MQEEKNIAESKEIAQNLLFKGDISGLTQEQKWSYYQYICQRLELDPLTQPFTAIKFSSFGKEKEVLYCNKGGAEQISKKHNVSHSILKKETQNDLYVVEARASLPNGRFVDDVGVVDIKGKSGNDLGNAMMKTITKAKRRATLSLLGLGMLDETEAETLPNAKVIDIAKKDTSPKETNGESKISPTSNGLGEGICVNCGVVIKSKRVIENSMTEFGKVLCWKNQNDCQEKIRQANQQEAEFSVPEFEEDEDIEK